jgi:hypothetical protein
VLITQPARARKRGRSLRNNLQLDVQRLSALADCGLPGDISRFLIQFDSYARTEQVMWLLMFAPMRKRIQIFLEFGNMCDAPWLYRTHIAKCLREARAEIELIELLGPTERAFYEALPDPIPIWRGCEGGRERGLHWTTNQALAQDFARGKRCFNKNPTLVTAEIRKQHVLAVFTSRKEDEVVVDYRRLRRLKRSSA